MSAQTPRTPPEAGFAAEPPDVLLLGVEWRARALIRAQLIEEGLDVMATSSWLAMRRNLRPGSKPRVAIVDLNGLSSPDQVLRDLAALMKPDRVLVLTASGTVARTDVERLGFRCLSRPFTIGNVVDAAAEAIRSSSTHFAYRKRGGSHE